MSNRDRIYNKNISSSSGFTLLELMIVIAILGVLSAIALPNFISYREKAKYSVALQNLRMIDKEIIAFNVAKGRFPDDLAEVGLAGLKDPWGNPYRYLNAGSVKGFGALRKDHSLKPVNTDYDLYSMGPDGDSKGPFTAKVSRDDIVRASNGSFFGRVSDY